MRKMFDTIIESPSPSPIPVTDSDSLMEEIDLFLASDDSMPPGIENGDYDSEGDIHFLEELLSNDSPPLPKNESSKLDHFNDPSSSRPPPKPSDVEVCFDIKPDKGVVTNKVLKIFVILSPCSDYAFDSCNDEYDNNNDQDSSNEDSEQENESEEQVSDLEQEEESEGDDQEDEKFVHTPSPTNDKDDDYLESESDYVNKSNEESDDVNKSDEESDDVIKGDKEIVQGEGVDAEMTDTQQGNENLETTQEQVVEDAYVTISTVTKKTEVPVTSSSRSSDLASKFLIFLDIPHTDAKIVSPLDVHVHHEVPRT
ncbi:hypothetical protein Tco_1173279 [Tanacetum coccineum]